MITNYLSILLLSIIILLGATGITSCIAVVEEESVGFITDIISLNPSVLGPTQCIIEITNNVKITMDGADCLGLSTGQKICKYHDRYHQC